LQFSKSNIAFWMVDLNQVAVAIQSQLRAHSCPQQLLNDADWCQQIYALMQVKAANKACCELFLVAEQTDFLNFFEQALKPKLYGFFLQIVKALLEQENFVEAEVELIDSNHGALYTILSVLLPSPDLSQVYFSVFDLTEKKKAELVLQETVLRYELVVEGAFGAIWDWNVAEKTVHFSESWCALRNADKNDFSDDQNEWVASIHPEDKPRVLNAVEQHFAGNTKVFEEQYRIQCKDGEVKWVADRGIAKWNEHGEVIRMAGSEFDITQQRAAQQKLKLAASVFENVSDGVVILDINGHILSANKAFSDISACTVDKVENIQLQGFISNESGQDTFRRLIEQGQGIAEISLLCQKKNIIPCRINVNSVAGEDGLISHYVCLLTDISRIKHSEQQLFELAHHDHLTQLPNRLLLKKNLEQFMGRASRAETQFAVVFIDLDHFKLINDAMGHSAGDELLKKVAQVLKSSVRKEDVVARLGGDEFILAIENVDTSLGLSRFVEHIQRQLSRINELRNQEIRVSASFGIAMYPLDGKDVATLIRNADTAMYRAKANGRHGFEFYTSDLTQSAINRMALETDLSHAIELEQLVLHYQPQVEMQSGNIIGVEALIRWLHPEYGLLSPDKFIPLAEETGQIEDVGQWVIATACAQAREWQLTHNFFGRMSVNVSGKQLQKGLLPDIVSRTLQDTGLEGHYLELELTESSVMQKTEFAVRQFNQLRQLGVSLAIDDFGTGYSSLSYLKRLPIDKLKIDKSFISDIPADGHDMAITQAIIVMAASLKLNVIAEGVEQQEQIDFLQQHGCQLAQGYLYSKPCPAEEIGALIQTVS